MTTLIETKRHKYVIWLQLKYTIKQYVSTENNWVAFEGTGILITQSEPVKLHSKRYCFIPLSLYCFRYTPHIFKIRNQLENVGHRLCSLVQTHASSVAKAIKTSNSTFPGPQPGVTNAIFEQPHAVDGGNKTVIYLQMTTTTTTSFVFKSHSQSSLRERASENWEWAVFPERHGRETPR